MSVLLILFFIVVGILLLGAALLSLAAALDTNIRKNIETSIQKLSLPTKPLSFAPVTYVAELVSEDDMKDNYEAPSEWEPRLITERLRKLREKPALLEYFLDSVKERLILGQDFRTSNSRIRFLRNQITELQIAKEYLIAFDDLNFQAIEREIRERELQLKKEDLENRRKAQQELDDLRTEKEKLKLQIDVAKLNKELRESDA